MIRRFSKKRQQTETRMAKVYKELDEEIGACAECGSVYIEHSHGFPRSGFPSMIDKKLNITLLCREHHNQWEGNSIGEMTSAPMILKNMITLAMNQEHDHIKSALTSYISGKIIRAHDYSPQCEWLKELYDNL